ncbi:OLD family protein [Tepidibacter thalassicus]|uniref:ATPase n=1 Tax=Tepidibacter thalassicus DSM 15285 TaxID=1123350 RepID=A0A1M5TMR8_9FIRM|nr:hypothetical protein [Tepidibacter thalassicus]SHH51663.1 hypothetical protein SAMN02744040_02223 [Tepidibacter thalassicus DSM 15285]
MNEIKSRYASFRDYIVYKKTIKNKIEEDIKKLKEEIDNLKIQEDTFTKAKILLEESSAYAREQIKYQFEIMVTKALQFITGENIEFKIEFEQKRGRPEASFYVITKLDDESEVKNSPEESRGGGIIDIISLTLKYCMLQTHNPPIEGPFILDEPAKHVSEQYIVNVGNFLKEINSTFNRQIIMVTHNTHLSEISDKRYVVSMENGISITKEYDIEQN